MFVGGQKGNGSKSSWSETMTPVSLSYRLYNVLHLKNATVSTDRKSTSLCHKRESRGRDGGLHSLVFKRRKSSFN